MEKKPRLFVGRSETKIIDSKNRIGIIPEFRRQLEEKMLFLFKERVQGYPLLVLRPHIRLDLENMSEEERMREYSAVPKEIDRQGRITLLNNELKYLANTRDIPREAIQTGGGDRIYVWLPEDLEEFERKSLESRD